MLMYVCTYDMHVCIYFCMNVCISGCMYTYGCLICYENKQANLDMTDSKEPGKLVRHMRNPSYTYDT